MKLRELCDRELEQRERPYRSSMSVGGAFMPGTETSVAQLLDAADAAIYAQERPAPCRPRVNRAAPRQIELTASAVS